MSALPNSINATTDAILVARIIVIDSILKDATGSLRIIIFLFGPIEEYQIDYLKNDLALLI